MNINFFYIFRGTSTVSNSVSTGIILLAFTVDEETLKAHYALKPTTKIASGSNHPPQ